VLFAAGHERITTVSTALPLLIGAVEAKFKATVEVAPLFLPRLGMRPSPRENESFIAATGASFNSGKNNGVLTYTLGASKDSSCKAFCGTSHDARPREQYYLEII